MLLLRAPVSSRAQQSITIADATSKATKTVPTQSIYRTESESGPKLPVRVLGCTLLRLFLRLGPEERQPPTKANVEVVDDFSDYAASLAIAAHDAGISDIPKSVLHISDANSMNQRLTYQSPWNSEEPTRTR